MDLLRRNLNPTVVLLDAQSFGGLEGSIALEDRLQKSIVPVCRILCGDDLGQVLSNF